ncbi:MAG: ORF6N domain-containing protein [bacterium]|nr:ORF6N domain-containing protein [bacterium]
MDLAIAEHANIASKIYEIRGLKVMLDRDLAELYQIETKYLNRMVSRNKKRFPEKYMFQLTKEEVDYLRCQFVTANISTKSRALPFVFTEHGPLQASSILNSNIAIEVNHKIIEAFVELRKQITISSQYETLLEKIKYIESRQEVGELSRKT